MAGSRTAPRSKAVQRQDRSAKELAALGGIRAPMTAHPDMTRWGDARPFQFRASGRHRGPL